MNMDNVDYQAPKGIKGFGKVNSSTRIKQKPQDLKRYHETCLQCNMTVSSRAIFCSHCGYVQIKNDLIHESSTSVYDPGDRSVKPWREKPIAAKNNWKPRTKDVVVGNKEPWRPTMKQSRVNKKKVLGVPSLLQKKSFKVGSGGDSEAPEVTAHQKRKQYDEARKIEVRYKGRIWRRAGEEHRRKRGLLQLPSMWVEAASDGSANYVREVPDEETFPLAVFEVDWMAVSLVGGVVPSEQKIDHHSPSPGPAPAPSGGTGRKSLMTIHISLYQHIMESDDIELETNKVQRWLRVGYLLDSSDNDSRDMRQSDTLKVLEFVPNAVAKCMGIREEDWVDLDYIDPNNSYMIEHLQKSMVHIARRVVPRPRRDAVFCDQVCSVVYVDSTGVEVFSDGHEDDDEDGVDGAGARAVMSGSYSRSVQFIRKLVSKEDCGVSEGEIETGSAYLRRHLDNSEEWRDDVERAGELTGRHEEEIESSSEFIRRHLAESAEDCKEDEVGESENGSEFIRRRLAELEAEDKEDKCVDDEKGSGDKSSEVAVGDESGSDFVRRHLGAASIVEEGAAVEDSRKAKELYEEYQAHCAEEKDTTESSVVETDELTMVDTVSQISCSIPVGAFYFNKRITTKVWMSVDWNRTDGIDQTVKTHPNFNKNFRSKLNLFDDFNVSSPLVQGATSHPSVFYDSVEFVARKPLVERITLRIFPMYYDDLVVLPKIVHFSTWSLTMLLDVHEVQTQMFAGNEVHVFGSDVRLSSLDISAYVLFCLSKGPSGAHALCVMLTKLLRYEHTTEGIKVFVSGVENKFCTCTSPEEMKLKVLENKYACIIIQCCFRKAIALRKMRKLARKKMAQQRGAATEIQRTARGYIERSMVKALRAQRLANEQQARLLAEEEKKDKILFCEMNNTPVEIIAHCGGCPTPECDSIGLDSKVAEAELAEMTVHVTDAESRKVCTLSINWLDLSHIWALYTSKFKTSLKFASITEVFNTLKARKKLLLFMANHCLELFLSRQSGFMKLTLKDLHQYIVSVTVRVASAVDLVNADVVLGGFADSLLGGKSDPYVTVTLGEEKYKTAVVKNNLNPVFSNEVVTFEWNHKHTDLLLCVYDKDLMSKDDFLGKCVVSLTSVSIPTVHSPPLALDMPLAECDHGSIQLEIHGEWASLT